MGEHYTKNTVSVRANCSKCGRQTDHRVDNGRRGPCMECIARLDDDVRNRAAEQLAQQTNLFGVAEQA